MGVCILSLGLLTLGVGRDWKNDNKINNGESTPMLGLGGFCGDILLFLN